VASRVSNQIPLLLLVLAEQEQKQEQKQGARICLT
jgi:hypothetical protein